MSRELLELIWVLEMTVALEPELAELLDEVVASELFQSDDLPKPTERGQAAPEMASATAAQQATMELS